MMRGEEERTWGEGGGGGCRVLGEGRLVWCGDREGRMCVKWELWI